ncbi:ABC transporter substrate-binding protein [Devosia sp. MC521]|uniref:ABC transporter substrate-binding protein n=1 Tax=Devosia sp. MC521 TaxID=2759954 RepID=UPI0015F839C9|nr:ABC transporter substrate-binding protein [Devosia sp. MC521]MBJ6988743.1 ABC transporter substrate-binding protein [Devosia sp. MC521]QMW63121.1 ABC transporter substrate-binding protein [Devosia sp. MC521]
MRLSYRVLCLSVAGLLSGFALSTPALAQVAQVVSATDAERVVQHAKGETTIPVAPERIVTLHNVFAEALISMGLAPIGSVDRPSGMPSQLVDGLAATETVGNHSEPDFERVLNLNPDLILAQAKQQESNYERLTGIAPTILLDEPEADWREWYVGLGDALGQADAVKATLEAYEAKAAAAKTELQAALGEQTILLLRVREKDIRVYGGARRSGPVLYQDLGLTAHESVSMADDHAEVSLENLTQLTADHIFLMVEDENKMSSIEEMDLWKRLPAVAAGHVYEVNIEPWNQSVGPISFGVIIDDVRAALL